MINSFLDSPMKDIALVLVSFGFVILSLGSATAQLPSQDPGHKENAEVARVKFSVPNSFNLEKSSNLRVAFMRHEEYDLGLFVAVPEKQVDDTYLTSLSNTLVSQLVPKEKDFRWKVLPSASDSKVSKFQTASGNTKGFNDKKFFQTHYITVNVKGHEILVGYITQLGEYNNSAKYLFDLKDIGGMSMPGWYAQAHILASVTGEKYEEINPETSIEATPVRGN
jgi:hypothetical protein